MNEFQELVGINAFDSVTAILNLLLLAWGLKRFLFKPVMKILNARGEQVTKLYSEAQTAKDSAEDMKTEYEERLANAKQEAAGIVKDATANAAVRADEILENAKHDAQHVKAKGEADLLRERKRAETELKNDISSIALSIAGKVVEKEIDASKHKALIDDFINNVGDAG